ncbi:hypothetical protein [Vibrio phage VP4B]|uniref:Uncharacterized protein n=1 Tax=Vibrio phage VP4B TaxID=1262540 RepID=V9LZF7_9CAUD|nr:hypothetical protein FDJ61_gp138 [Vibrio phage VP4B]AGB07252.1 hypothetical protein [Vibrio phage VP4B]
MSTIRVSQLIEMNTETLLTTLTVGEARTYASTAPEQLVPYCHDFGKCRQLHMTSLDVVSLLDCLSAGFQFVTEDSTVMDACVAYLFNSFALENTEARLTVNAYFNLLIDRPISVSARSQEQMQVFFMNAQHRQRNVVDRLRDVFNTQAQVRPATYGYNAQTTPQALNRVIDNINRQHQDKEIAKTVTVGEFRVYQETLRNRNKFGSLHDMRLQTVMNRVELIDHVNHLMASLTGEPSGAKEPTTVIYEHMLKLAESYFEGCDHTTYTVMLATICFGEALLSTNHLTITQVLRDRVLMIVPATHPYYQTVLSMLELPAGGAWGRGKSTSAGHSAQSCFLPPQVEKAFLQYNSGNMEQLIDRMNAHLMTDIINATGHAPLTLPMGSIPDDVARFGGIIHKAELVFRTLETGKGGYGCHMININNPTPIATLAAETLAQQLEVRILDNIKPLTKALLFGMRSGVKTVLTQDQLNKLDEILETLHLEPLHYTAVRESYAVEVKPSKADDEMMETLMRANAEATLDHAMVDGLINISHEATPSKIKAFWLDLLFNPVDQLKGKYPTAIFDAVHNGARRMAEEEHGFYQGALELLTAMHELRVESVKEPEEEVNSLNNIVLRARNNATEILKEESPWILEVDELNEGQLSQIKELCKNPLYTLALATLPVKTWEEDTLYEGEDAVVVGLKDLKEEESGEPNSLGSVSECTTIIEQVVEGMKELDMIPRPGEKNLHELLINYFNESGTSMNQLVSSLALIYSERDVTLESKNAIIEAYEFCVNNGEQETSVAYLPEVNIGRLLHLVLNK